MEEILNTDSSSKFLGEIALVNYDSPISNTKKIFKSTLLDENASSHVALGSGFLECLENGDKLNEKTAKKMGINSSKTHVDFMIGTKDMTVIAETYDGKNIKIMENGNLEI